jgi:hypothetical protein
MCFVVDLLELLKIGLLKSAILIYTANLTFIKKVLPRFFSILSLNKTQKNFLGNRIIKKIKAKSSFQKSTQISPPSWIFFKNGFFLHTTRAYNHF